MAVHSVVAGQRLLDVLDLVESDRRAQLVYTQAPDAFGHEVGEFLRSIGALEIPWSIAVRERFDLALAAAYGGIEQLHAPVMVFPHGAAFGKRMPNGGPVYGLDAQRLMRDGQVVPASVVLSHESQRRVLGHQCPPALDVAVVAGDPCYDRMAASLSLRDDYRCAMGVRPGQQLVVFASTWGPHSLFERYERHLPTLLRQLDPDRYRAAAVIHPAVWFGHGRRQVRAWLSVARSAGLTLVAPEDDWRSAVLAADYVIGDHGSTTVYAASIGTPVLRTDLPIGDLNPDSPQALLGATTPRLIRSRPLEPQLRAAATVDTSMAAAVVARLTSRPGAAHRVLRREMYRLLELSIPGRHRAVDPIPLPTQDLR